MRLVSVFVLLLLLFTACKNGNDQSNVSKPEIIHDTVYIERSNHSDWQRDFGLTHDPNKDSVWYQPVSYYLNDKDCSAAAADFYYGQFRPSDNRVTDDFLELACTDNAKLRPFYRWCLNKTLVISDGALGEHVGVPARKYAEKFPDEFFGYVDGDNDKYELWVAAIQYSGFFDYKNYMNNPMNNPMNRKTLIEQMTKNLKVKSEAKELRIRKFALDCTPDGEESK